ncbi:transcription factor bHLH18-like isoform X2 [Sesamum indicum]|uniref:Transcription factor bHLH18-like isoform X2 n=1 Tax=Sesamum indicum TaxID=4182 RepID=A0A6I9TJ20_SESIN|nr:transcription factor bHLH18-like isoform X2 [Sesamum indicum]
MTGVPCKEGMEMEMEEYFDEMFGVKANKSNIPAHHEIFTSHPFSTNTTNQLVEYPPSWNLSCTTQQTTPKNVPSSSASASASAYQLIYVENKNAIPSLEESLVHDQFVSPYNGLTANLSSNTLLNFSSPVLINQHDDLSKRVSCSSLPVRSTLQARDHLVAERKRREKLGQLFITLSKVVPGIKKLDKASILEDAIDYIKILEEQIRVLEIEQVEKRSEDIDNSTSKESSNIIDDSMNELSAASAIKVRISDRNVLIKILCKKQKGFMSRIHMEMEKMNLCEVDVRVMPFGRDALDITILAQMQSELCVTVKDIVDHLDMAFFSPPHMQ